MANFKRRSPSGEISIEALFYELKPILLFVFSVYFLRSSHIDMLLVKYFAMLIFTAATYISAARLFHRGYL
jgi:hypothetical protein